jgi:hypothetical protein
MIQFKATIEKFGSKGEKTGWTYLVVPAHQADQLSPGKKTGFRVTGKIDGVPVTSVALLPMGEGNFILALNAALRKKLAKPVGETVTLSLKVETREQPLCADLLECLADEPLARERFEALTPGHRRYFSKWVEEAKLPETRAKRIAHCLHFLSLGKDFGSMLRALKAEKAARDY